ncbi:MAG TPA: SAVED domain-containing protein, partial [Myxococcota bacterium]|nr:SAVED domain-containing protein [Myxococcota bacterium]
WPRLRAELIAPHHPGYREEEALEAREAISQRGGRTGIPSYVEEPRPVSFLAVEPGARFRLFLASTGRAPADLDQVWDWLTLGLDLLGFGGKTASGFGRMLPPEGRQAPRAPTPGEPDEPIGPAMDGPRLLIAFEANLGGRSASVSEAEVRSAEPSITGPTVWWNRSGQALPNLQTGWPKVLSRLTGERDKLTRQVAGMTPRPSVTIAALGEIPALIALGWVIGDATPAEAILKRRGEPWGWAPDAPDDPPLELRRPADPAGSIALVLSLSGRVDTSALPPAPDGAWAIWEIAPPEPSLGAIRSRGQRDRLLRLVREAVGAARPRSGAPVHVFPAIPAAIAVELGLAWSPRAWPPMWIYDAGPRWTGPYKLER